VLGSRDEINQLGYVMGQCPACKASGVFSVFEMKRKLTVYMIPTRSYDQRKVVECRNCQRRFAVPPEQQEELLRQLLSPEQLTAQGRVSANGPALPGRRGRTYYQTLQVDQDADPEVIEAAFRRLALKYHPDKSTLPDAADRMRDILAAKDILSDPRKRRAYDASLGIERKPEGLRPDQV
jgi:hypothetical protein